jgi:hypothetical protein
LLLISARCTFMGHERNCSEIFSHVITDKGQCCSFNIMPDYLMYRSDVIEVSDRKHTTIIVMHQSQATSSLIQAAVDDKVAEQWDNWELQQGYRHSIDGKY